MLCFAVCPVCSREDTVSDVGEYGETRVAAGVLYREECVVLGGLYSTQFLSLVDSQCRQQG